MPRRSQHLRRPFAGLVECHAAIGERAGDHVQRGHARNGAQELRDIAERGAADLDDLGRRRLGDVDHPAVMADEDLALIDQIIAVRGCAAAWICRCPKGRPGPRTSPLAR